MKKLKPLDYFIIALVLGAVLAGVWTYRHWNDKPCFDEGGTHQRCR